MSNNPTYYKKEVKGNKAVFQFDNMDMLNRFIDENIVKAQGQTYGAARGINSKDQNYIMRNINNINWFGTTNLASVTGPVDIFLFNNDLNTFLQNIQDKLRNVGISDLDQTKTIKFSELEKGVFSFDLASLGLIKVFEFYSPLLKKVVSGNLVVSEKQSDGNLIFYHVYMPEIKEHKVEYNIDKNGYYSDILRRNIPFSELEEKSEGSTVYMVYPYHAEIPKHIVHRKQVIENGRPKFSSTFKKSFIDIPKVKKPMPRIDIIVNSSFNSNISAIYQMKYNALSAIALAEQLTRLNINYKIISVNSTLGKWNKKAYSFTTIKNEGEPMDKNQMALILSDGRYFRIRSFYETGSLFQDAGGSWMDAIGEELGTAIYDLNDIKNAYMEMLQNSDNIEDKNAAKYPDTKIVLGSALSEMAAMNQYQKVINQLQK